MVIVSSVFGSDVALVKNCADVEIVIVPANLDTCLQIVWNCIELLVLMAGDVHHIKRPLSALPGCLVELSINFDLL